MADGKSGTELTQVEIEQRRDRNQAYAATIFEMLARGESFRTISAATGVPTATVHRMSKRLGAEYVRDYYGDHTSVLGRELHILDQLTRKNLGPATRGDKDAAQIVLASHTRRCKLLGLDAAVRAELTVKTAKEIEIERLVAMLRDVPPAAQSEETEQ